MSILITIYHGSRQIVEVPTSGLERKPYDFGLGFYCTESNELRRNGQPLLSAPSRCTSNETRTSTRPAPSRSTASPESSAVPSRT